MSDALDQAGKLEVNCSKKIIQKQNLQRMHSLSIRTTLVIGITKVGNRPIPKTIKRATPAYTAGKFRRVFFFNLLKKLPVVQAQSEMCIYF